MQNYRTAPPGGGRRGPGPMVAPPHANPPQPIQHPELQRKLQEEVRAREHAMRTRAARPTDRDIPEELSEAVVAGDGVEKYRQLREVERKLDAMMVRKRLEITDSMERPYERREGTMRVWISNTAQGQPWQAAEDGDGMGDDSGILEFGEQNSQATFRLKIEGRLIEPLDRDVEEEDGLEDAEKERLRRTRPRFSHFFRSITVDFDRNAAVQPDSMAQIEWRKPQEPSAQPPGRQSVSGIDFSGGPEASFDCLEFERQSDENINITVSLQPEEQYIRYKTSPQLTAVTDLDECDMAGAVEGIWEYCRAMGLQEDNDRRTIVCDDALRTLFGRDTFYFPQVKELLPQHLTPIPPIQLAYTIRVDKPYISSGSKPTIYDLPHISLPNPCQRQNHAFHASNRHATQLKQIIGLDDDLALVVQAIHRTNAKRKFYTNLSKDPKGFIQRWVSSQKRDLEVILVEDRIKPSDPDALNDEFRRGGKDSVWSGGLARESVGLWLARGKAS